MKKRGKVLLCFLFMFALLLFTLVACGGTSSNLTESNVIPAFSETEAEWNAKFEAEWRAMGLNEAPKLLPIPNGQVFDYALLTPGTADVPDAEAMIIALMGDGFSNDPAELAKWHYYCQYFARIMLQYSPFNEFKDVIKIYRLDIISEASGVTRSDSPDGRNMPDDPKNTYFGGSLWNKGMARLGGMTWGEKASALTDAYFPTNPDVAKNLLLNTSIYGGSGGADYAYSTLSWAFVDLVTHEMTHTTGSLPDEYLNNQLESAKNSYVAYSNLVHRDWIENEDWQEWNSWYRLLGKNGTTFNPFTEAITTDPDYINLFRPSPPDGCKMRFLGLSDMYDETGNEEFGFCEVCKEVWRDRIVLLSKTPVLHFQPYNDKFYDNESVLLNDKNFILRIPANEDLTGIQEIKSLFPAEHCQKVYAENINNTTPQSGIQGEFKMTVLKDGVVFGGYESVPVTTPLELEAGIYTVKASFEGTYNGEPLTLSLASLENEFEVKPQTILTEVGKYDEPWNSQDAMDTLTRPWQDGVASKIPALSFDPARVGGSDMDQFEVTYSWYTRDFNDQKVKLIGGGNYSEDAVADGPTSVGRYILSIRTKAAADAPLDLADYDVTNDYPFEIETPFRPSNHYEVDAGTYTHESVSHDFRGITIVGEGFTEDEQDKFETAAQEFITTFLDTDPVKRVPERFCFFIENTMSADSGITMQDGASKDTYYGFQINTNDSLGTYREDMSLDMIMFNDVWRRDTNLKTWVQWGATVVLVNEDSVQTNYNWRHPESNRSAHVATLKDKDYTRLIEALVTQFAHVRSNRDEGLLETYRWMDKPERFEETMQRLIESCYSHQVYYKDGPKPVIYSDAATKVYLSDGSNWDLPDTFEAYAFGHKLQTGVNAEDTFIYNYYTDDGYRVGTKLEEAPTAPGLYWAEAILPGGPKQYAETETDRYGFTYEKGQLLQGKNGEETMHSTPVRGFVRFEIAEAVTPPVTAVK